VPDFAWVRATCDVAAKGMRGLRQGVTGSRSLLHRHVTAKAAAEEALTEDQRWRRHQVRQIAALVTIPGIVLGTASIAAAYGSGLMTPTPAPTCDPIVVKAPARGSFDIRVLNASGVNGAATVVGKDLTKRGFKIIEASSAPRNLYVARPVAIYHGNAGLDQALLAAQQVQGAELYNDGRPGTSISFVLGGDFTRLLPAPPPKPPKLSSISVNVFNTTYRAGLASTVESDLLARGFAKGKVGNDPDGSFLPNDVAVIRYGEDGDLAAKALADHVPNAVLRLVPRAGTSVDLVLGNKFENLVPTADVPPRPVPPPDPTPTVARPCTPAR
jgi:hypothetical protein